MPSPFEKPDWHQTMAAIIATSQGEALAEGLMSALAQAVQHDGSSLIAFHRDAPPVVLYHTLSPDLARHYLDRYLAGPYLLDPLYELAMRADKPGMCRFRDTTPDRFHSSEYYRQYCERTHLRDEMDFLVDVADGTTLALVVGRREKQFSRAELSRLELVRPVVLAAMRRAWEHWAERVAPREPARDMHHRLTRCFDNFGEAVLTEREREITQLLLRGHSTKSVARELDIAPGTVMVHKRNLFAKLGITSQFALFSLFIEALSQS